MTFLTSSGEQKPVRFVESGYLTNDASTQNGGASFPCHTCVWASAWRKAPTTITFQVRVLRTAWPDTWGHGSRTRKGAHTWDVWPCLENYALWDLVQGFFFKFTELKNYHLTSSFWPKSLNSSCWMPCSDHSALQEEKQVQCGPTGPVRLYWDTVFYPQAGKNSASQPSLLAEWRTWQLRRDDRTTQPPWREFVKKFVNRTIFPFALGPAFMVRLSLLRLTRGSSFRLVPGYLDLLCHFQGHSYSITRPSHHFQPSCPSPEASLSPRRSGSSTKSQTHQRLRLQQHRNTCSLTCNDEIPEMT